MTVCAKCKSKISGVDGDGHLCSECDAQSLSSKYRELLDEYRRFFGQVEAMALAYDRVSGKRLLQICDQHRR